MNHHLNRLAAITLAATLSTGCIGISVNKPGSGSVVKLESVTITPARSAVVYYAPSTSDDPGRAEGVIDREENGWLALRCPDGREVLIRVSQIQRIDYM